MEQGFVMVLTARCGHLPVDRICRSVDTVGRDGCQAGFVAANGTSRIQCCFRAPLPASISGVGCGCLRHRLPRAVRGIGCEESAPSPDASLVCKRSVTPIIATPIRDISNTYSRDISSTCKNYLKSSAK